MKVAVMQPYIFPYIGYYQLINAVDKFVVYDDVNFINKGWINRNYILVNGSACLFSIPLKNASQNRLIQQVELSEEFNWRTKLLKTIEHSYKKAPCFTAVYPILTDVIMSQVTKIHELAVLSLKSVCNYLQVKTGFQDSSSLYDNKPLKGQERIINICEKEKAYHYINPIGGTEIYSRTLFEEKGIKLSFIKTEPITYRQFKNDFVPHLSIIDVLMFNPKDEVIKMLSQYELLNEN
jgi:hypothetical protein